MLLLVGFRAAANQQESDRVVFPRTKRSGAQRAHVSCAPGLAKPPSGTGVATDLPTCAVPGVANRAARAGRVPPTSRPSQAARSRSPAPGHPVATARGDGPGAMGDVERMMRGGHEWPGAGANKPLNGGRAWRWACSAVRLWFVAKPCRVCAAQGEPVPRAERRRLEAGAGVERGRQPRAAVVGPWLPGPAWRQPRAVVSQGAVTV